jgi:hypothetical protein
MKLKDFAKMMGIESTPGHLRVPDGSLPSDWADLLPPVKEGCRMEVETLLQKKAELELSILDALEKFRADTGFSIKALNIHMADVTAHSDKIPAYVPGKVSCEIAFPE